MSANQPATANTIASTPPSFFTPMTGAIFLLVMLLALVLRLDGFRDDLWADELHTAWVADGSWSELISRAAIGNQPPLYFAVVKLVTQIAGMSEFSLRLLSLLSGMSLVLAGWRFTWRVTGDRWCALVAAFSLGIDSTCVYYSSEARSYALLQLVLAWLVILVTQNNVSRVEMLARALFAALAIHLQFTSLIFLTPIYLARMASLWMRTKDEGSQRLSSMVIEIAIIFMFTAPMALQVGEIAARGEAWATFVPKPSWQGLVQLFPWTPAAISLLGVAVVRLFLNDRASKRPPVPDIKAILGWLSWCSLSPVVLAIVIALLNLAPVFYRRYLLAALWPLLMLPGMALCQTRSYAKAALLLAVVIAMTWHSGLIAPEKWSTGRLVATRGESWGQATLQITKTDPRGELPLFIASGFIESRQLKENPSPLLHNYCNLPVATLYPVSQSPDKLEPISSIVPYEPPKGWVDGVIEHEGGIWLLRVRQSGEDAWRRFADRFLKNLEVRSPNRDWQATFHVFAGVVVFEIRPARKNSS